MSWKIFALQSAALVLLSWLIGQYVAVHHRHDLPVGQADSSAQLEAMNQRLARLEQTVSRLSTTVPPAAVPSQPAATQPDNAAKEAALQLSKRLDELEKWAKKMQLIADALTKNQALLAQMRKPAASKSAQPMNWLAALPKEKRLQVQAAYREQVEQMQKSVSTEPDAPPPAPDEMMSILQESRENLKRKLKDILDEAEYQAFLNSLDEKSDLPPVMPPGAE